jgi:hypothetical protein
MRSTRRLLGAPVGSPKELEGTFIEVNALASVNGEDPERGITEGLPT